MTEPREPLLIIDQTPARTADADHLPAKGASLSVVRSSHWSGVAPLLRGALVVIFAGIFDIVDGEVARRTKRVTKFGAFFDSVIDRYSDLLLLLGLIGWFARINRLQYVWLTGLCLIGSVLTSYTRARAESLIPACKVGFLERPERIVLLVIGALTDRMAAALWVMAILSNWTVSQRIWYTWRELSAMERRARGAAS